MEHQPYRQPPAVEIEIEMAIVNADNRNAVMIKRYVERESAHNSSVEQAVPAFQRVFERLMDRFLEDMVQVFDQPQETGG